VRFLTYADLHVPRGLAASFAKVRAAIERDDFASADVKKLTGRPFFRAKLDNTNRVLLQFVRSGGDTACLALELIENHAYDRSRFLRGARVDESRGLDAAQANVEFIEQHLEPARYLHTERGEFHFLTRPLSFDDRQEELRRTPLPMVLVGCAGSGKTSLTLIKLRELTGEVLYVTHSRYLAESAAQLYFAHGYENSEQNVDFLHYARLLESIEVPRGRAVALSDFRSFFKRHEQQLRFTTAHQLFEELRGVLTADAGGPLTQAQYQALGVRQSIYPEAQRATVFAHLAKYVAWLGESGLYDPNLLAHAYRARAERRYDAVVVDEVQDLTNAELALVLATMKEPDQFLLCGDANQIVHPNFFAWAKVKSLFYAEEAAATKAPIHVLGVNYRSSRRVCELANTLLKIKNLRFGSIDRESTALVKPASPEPGKVLGLNRKDAVLRDLNQRTRGSAKVAVIVLGEEHKAEARRSFSTPLVFTVHEAKGLEYEAVILFDLVSSERARYREITDGITTRDLDADELTYSRAKDKGDKSLELYKFFVNSLYVALTRAVETVYLVEGDAQHPLLGLLGILCGDDVSGVATTASSTEEWQREARRLELQGKLEQANAIRTNVLRVAPVPWPVLDRSGFEQVRQKALAPNTPHNKAKQQLFEFAAFHGIGTLAFALKMRANFRPPRELEETQRYARERAMGPYLAGDHTKVLADVGRYGLEHRCMMGLTPLMMAADVGDVTLVEVLLDRGAAADAVDSLGRLPVHFALSRAFTDKVYARDKLGPLYDLLCPTAIELEVDGRRLRLGRNQGEFFVLLCVAATFHELHRGMQRYSGFTAKTLSAEALAEFPRSVVPDVRRKQSYWNGVLARAEVDSTYRPARKLWRRERVGHYVPSSAAVRVTASQGNTEAYVPLPELLALRLLTA
jgi:AAA domain